MLSKKPGKEAWHYGLEADYFSRQEGEIPVSGLLGIWNQDQETEIDGEKYTPGKLMEIYLRGCISLLGIGEPVRQIKAVMVTVPKLSPALIQASRQCIRRES